MPCQAGNDAGEMTNGQLDVPTTIIQVKRDIGDPLDPRRQKPSGCNDEGEAMQCTMKTHGH